ncbi:MAG: TIGR02266 family protein [Myxococcaceae bacterium]
MPETPAAIGLVVKLPFATPEEFLTKYGANLTRGGIYLRSKSLKAVGTPVTLDLKLADGTRLLYASATVHFVTGNKGEGAPGMGLRFTSVDEASKRFLEEVAATLPHASSREPPVPNGVGKPDYTVPPSAPVLEKSARPTVTSSSAPVAKAPAFEESVEPPKRTGPIIGIDLGTTNSCAAFVRNGKPAVFTSREGYNTVPSILALTARGKLSVGHPAKGQMLTNPRQTVYGAKRLVGRAFDSPTVQQIKDRFHYEIASGPNAEAAVKLGDRVYTLEQISALILREVRELAEQQVGAAISRAVITVPAYYNDNQRQAVREAGRLAGIHVERILNEPTAAALAYGYGRALNQRILVYDLGGGTFDASVLELTENVYEVISTGGDTFLGGIDFDNVIVEHLLQQFEKKNGKPFVGDRVARQRVADAAERAKCLLSERQEMRVHVPFITMIHDNPYDLDVVLTRDVLVQILGTLVDRTLQVCSEVLKAKGLTPKDIDEIILVGGQSRFPLVHEKITRFFGKPPSKGVHPDEAVAVGASLLAHSLGQLEGVVLIDVLPMSVGIGLPGGRFKRIIERNTSLPAAKSYEIATSHEDQTVLELAVFQGDSEKAMENEYLGTLKLGDLPKAPKGSVKMDVTFAVNNEGLLKVTAKETTSGREVSNTFSTREKQDAVKAKLRSDSPTAPDAPEPPPPPPKTVSDAAPAPRASTKPPPLPPEVPSAEIVAAANAKSSGFFGWFKKLFGRTG